ncbi:MAG TPA: hypothetical protein VMC62_06240 [Longilinea sp.]|nr:hypothetical protein [Longilinea sp.]
MTSTKYSASKYFIIAVLLWVVIDWGTASGFRISYFAKYGATLLLFYIGYPLIFTTLIFLAKLNDKALFIATLIGIFIVEVVFTRNPMIMTFPICLLGIPLALAIYLPLTYFPLWYVRGEIKKYRLPIIFLTMCELVVIFLTTFGGIN